MLGDLANWAQIISVLPLTGGVWLWYMHHRCKHCRRPGRYKVGPHQVPVCHRHREREANTPG